MLHSTRDLASNFYFYRQKREHAQPDNSVRLPYCSFGCLTVRRLNCPLAYPFASRLPKVAQSIRSSFLVHQFVCVYVLKGKIALTGRTLPVSRPSSPPLKALHEHPHLQANCRLHFDEQRFALVQRLYAHNALLFQGHSDCSKANLNLIDSQSKVNGARSSRLQHAKALSGGRNALFRGLALTLKVAIWEQTIRCNAELGS